MIILGQDELIKRWMIWSQVFRGGYPIVIMRISGIYMVIKGSPKTKKPMNKRTNFKQTVRLG